MVKDCILFVARSAGLGAMVAVFVAFVALTLFGSDE